MKPMSISECRLNALIREWVMYSGKPIKMKALRDSTKEYFLTYSRLYPQQVSPTWFMRVRKKVCIWSEEISFMVINLIDMADRWQLLYIGNGFAVKILITRIKSTIAYCDNCLNPLFF